MEDTYEWLDSYGQVIREYRLRDGVVDVKPRHSHHWHSSNMFVGPRGWENLIKRANVRRKLPPELWVSEGL